MKKVLLLSWPFAAVIAFVLVVIASSAHGQSLTPGLTPSQPLSLEPTIKVIPSPEVKIIKIVPAVAASSASAVVAAQPKK